MNEAIQRLRRVSDAYEAKVGESASLYEVAARAEADYRAERAKAVLRHKATRDRMSVAEAETRADADNQVYQLHTDRLVSAALAEAHKDRLRQLKEREASCRTEVTTEREADRIHAVRGDRA